MIDRNNFDMVVIGGGVGGSSIATVLARQGYRVAIVEREPEFRDRVRGEGLHPWGYRQAIDVGLKSVIDAAGANPLPVWQSYRDREPVEPTRWDDDPENDYPEFGISHPSLQRTSLAAAVTAGAVTYRPMAARRIERAGDRWEVTLEGNDGGRHRISGGLLIGADGRDSAVRRWLGVKTSTDPLHHRFGGMLVERFGFGSGQIHSVGLDGGTAYIMPQKSGKARIYAGGEPALLEPIVADRSGKKLIDVLARALPDSAMAGVRSAGPMAFFPNSDVVSKQIAGDGWALIGDAAGSNDPSVGQGLSLTYRDVRRLTELLAEAPDRSQALAEYAAERRAYHETAREHAKWIASFTMESGEKAASLYEGFRSAREIDPTQGGFAFMYTRGPMGLRADDDARRAFFNLN